MALISHLRCLCHEIHLPVTLLVQQTVPIQSELCHCNSCRHTSGALCPAYLPLTDMPPSEILAKCTRYKRPEGEAEQYFCTKCGTRTFDCSGPRREWFACSGTAEPKVEDEVGVGEFGVIQITSHDFVGDTLDGGLAKMLRRPAGREVSCYVAWRDGDRMTDAELDELAVSAAKRVREKKLFVACRCQSIKFYVLPPENDEESIKKPEIARWLRDDGRKYLALNCACNYCRRAVGFSFSSNAYVMPENIVMFEDERTSLFDYTSGDKSTSDFEKSSEGLVRVLPHLRFDFTSPGIRRSWCGECGASVFFERASRPQCVNISMGILRAESGSLAKEWIDFDWQVFFKESAVDREIVHALQSYGTRHI